MCGGLKVNNAVLQAEIAVGLAELRLLLKDMEVLHKQKTALLISLSAKNDFVKKAIV
jgi:hypothetical protein